MKLIGPLLFIFMFYFVCPSSSDEVSDATEYNKNFAIWFKEWGQFGKTPSLNIFEKIPPRFRGMSLVDILTDPDPRYQPGGDFFKLKQDIIKTYLDSLPPQEQQPIYENAFTMATNKEKFDPKLLESFFEKGTLNDPKLIHQVLCDSLTNLTTEMRAQSNLYSRPEDLGAMYEREKRTLKSIVPLIKKYPTSFDNQCITENAAGTFVFNITDIVYVFFPQTAFELKNIKTVKAQTEIAKPFGFTSSCSEHEIRCYFKDALSSIKDIPGPIQHIMIIKSGNCQIMGSLNKTKFNTYEFLQNYGQATEKSNKKTLLFLSLDEISVLFKATQKSVSDGEKPKPLPKYADGQLDCREVFGGKKSIVELSKASNVMTIPATAPVVRDDSQGGAIFSPFGRP